MIEFTVPLTFPLRTVVLTRDDFAAPEWIQEGFVRLAQGLVARHPQVAGQSVVSALELELQQELEQVRQQREAWQQGLAELQRNMQQVQAQTESNLQELRQAAIELGHAIACKLVFQQLTSGTFPVDRLVNEVLARLNQEEPVTVRLHPLDLGELQQKVEFVQSLESERIVRLMADPKLKRGDCKATSGEVTVVYELQRQIEEIRRELLSTVTGHAESGP